MRQLHRPMRTHIRNHMRSHTRKMRTSKKHGASIFGYNTQTFINPNDKFTFVKDTNGRSYRAGKSKAADKWLDKLGVVDREKVIAAFGKTYIIDGIDLTQKIAYEYLGNTYHGSHKTFPINRDIPIKFLNKTPNQLYNGTIERFKFLTLIGFKVFFVWESDDKKGFMGRFYMGNNDNLY